MALVDVDSWLTELGAIESLSHTLLRQIVQRDKSTLLSPEYNRLTAQVQIGLTQFDTELWQLKLKLDATTTTSEEKERRRRQLDELQSMLRQLQSRFTTVTRNDRTLLLEQSNAAGASSPWQTTGGGDASYPVITPTNDVDMLKQRQTDLLENQNRGLETLSQTISRQRQLATQLGQEVEDQNDILDNLANTMESVDARVSVETGNISYVTRQDNPWLYWVIIFALLVAILVVAVA